ncbi:MAG: hypothetical protein ACKV2T_31210 [Kofleriaceae bacterium]
MRTTTFLALGLAATACTTLGPTPATTGVSAVPVGRPGVELQAGIMPAFYLSDAANDGSGDQSGTAQVHAIIEPDRILGTKGLILGARKWGEDGDSPIEPMVGYRRRLDSAFSIGAVAYGGHADGSSSGATYQATRFGGELAIDAGIQSRWSWLSGHLMASLSATYLDATGEYCVNPSGVAIDCDNENDRRVDGAVEGVYTAATAGAAIDIARRPHGSVQSIRLFLLGAIGVMPKLRDGMQMPSNNGYYSIGLGVSFGFGSPD